MLIERAQAKIVAFEATQLEAGEPWGAVSCVAETGKIKVAHPYWFRCSACSFDWEAWIRPSILFVSLAFVTDECPNCRNKHVPACRGGPENGSL